MARAYKCDRCGRFYEVNYVTKESFLKAAVTLFEYSEGEPTIGQDSIDLCSDCQDKLIAFLNHYKGKGESGDDQRVSV